MIPLKPAAMAAALLLGAWLGANASAATTQAQFAQGTPTAEAHVQPDADARAYANLPVCKLSPDGKRLMVEPCRTAPAAAPMPRRPVPLTIQRMPNNKVAPQVAMPQIAPSMPIETLMQPPGTPMPALGCTAAGCYDPSGARHNTGPAGTTITPAGKLCNRQGAWIQC